MKIKGKYDLISKLQNSKGEFQLSMSKVVYEETLKYQMEKGNFQLLSYGAKLNYEKMNPDYDNIGFFAQVFEEAISKKFLADIEKKIGEEVGPKMKQIMVSKMRSSKIDEQKLHQLTEAVKQAVNEAHQLLQGEFKVELKDGQPEELRVK